MADNGLNSILSYYDIRVKLFEIGQGSNSSNNFAINYNDCFSFGDSVDIPDEAGCYPLDVSKIIYTTDATPGTLSGTVLDSNLSKYNNPHKDGFHDSFHYVTPNIGDGIAVFIKKSGDLDYKIIFKGYLTSVSKKMDTSGIVYSVEAADMKIRLAENIIRKRYNMSFRVGTLPNYKNTRKLFTEGANGKDNSPYTTQRMTIKEILCDVMNYSRCMGLIDREYNFCFFGPPNGEIGLNDITSYFDFNNMSDLEDFIPPTVFFDNITILEAVYRLINMAGSYRMMYNPSDDKIYFERMSSSCRKCGGKILLNYGLSGGESNSSSNNSEQIYKDWVDVNVITDSTSRRTNGLCNVLKVYSSDIEWYSGNFYIERKRNSVPNFSSDYKYKDDKCYFPDSNWDGYGYWFDIQNIPFGAEGSNSISQTTPYEIVGCPLYPSWNPSDGYKAHKEYIGSAIVKDLEEDATGNKMTNATIDGSDTWVKEGMTENDMSYIEKPSFMQAIGKSPTSFAKGFSYEAWFPYGVCPACDGSGAVSSNFSVPEGFVFGETRSLTGASKIAISSSPFNYGFKARGKSGQLDKVRGFVTGFGENEYIPTNHPVPWINTCPICRGTGMEPWFRMTSLQNVLVDLSPDQMKIGNNKVETTSNSNGYAKNKTWAQVAQGMTYRYPLTVQVETQMQMDAYSYGVKDSSNSSAVAIQHSISYYGESQSSVSSRLIFDPDNNNNIERNVYSLYYTTISTNFDYSIDVDRAMIIFKNAQYIGCRRPFKKIERDSVTIENNGEKQLIDNAPVFKGAVSSVGATRRLSGSDSLIYLGQNSMNGISKDVAAYWRPARAWITCLFKRDNFFTYMGNSNVAYKGDMSGMFNDSERVSLKKKIKADGESDIEYGYVVRPKVEDNRYCVEIIKTKDSQNGIEGFSSRPIISATTLSDIRWQICPWDFGKWNVPTNNGESGNSFVVPSDYLKIWETVLKGNKDNNYIYKNAAFHTIEPLREEEAKSLKIAADAMRSDKKGKILSWVLRDDRIKMIERGTSELEKRNSIQVSGSVEVSGFVPDFENSLKNKNGLGYVTLLDGKKATIVKNEMTFSNGMFTMSLEVGTEEYRFGMPMEEQLDYQRKIETEIGNLNTAKPSSSMPVADYKRGETTRQDFGGLGLQGG